LDWFAAVELHAWRKVDCYYSDLNLKPKTIFLVIGQILASEYFISHKEHRERACEIKMKEIAQLPGILDTNALLNYNITKVVASSGFEEVVRKNADDPRRYSIVLDLHISQRVHQFDLKKLLMARVEVCYK
jgi:hypothetical protein